MKKEICFVVLNYNDSDTTIKLVDLLSKWKADEEKYQIVVVDNKSQDDSYERLKRRFDKASNVDILLSEKNGGYSYGNNFGAKYAIKVYQPKYIVIANPDILIEEKTFEKLLETFRIDKNAAMVAPVMQDVRGNYSIYAQMLPRYKDDLMACFNSTRSKTIVENNFEYFNQNVNMIFTQMLPGSFFVIQADVFEKIGMFDENVFLFCEERILGKKLYDKGYKVILRSDLFFTHIHSTSIKKSYDILETWKLIMKSRLYYETEYNKISWFQTAILKICMNLFNAMLKNKMTVYKMLKGNR